MPTPHEPIKKHELINLIQGLESFSDPKLEYEQYITDAIATADLFYFIAFEKQDLFNKVVIDLGCGTGNLSIAAAIMGAEHVVAIDIDHQALAICKRNIHSLNLEEQITTIQADIGKINFLPQLKKHLGTIPASIQENRLVVSNPPFGTRNRGIDTQFLKIAMQIAPVIYSIHLYSPKSRNFLKKKIEQWGGRITDMASLALVLKHTYSHQQHKQKNIRTDVYRIVR